MKLLNLGCGSRYHTDWTNIDFFSRNSDVIEHNLLTGIPFPDNHFDVVYHSHVLEHFSRKDGHAFLQECYRVLKPGGIIRIAVPDLEGIAREYLKQLELAAAGDKEAAENYNWIMLEMYDQAVRTTSGGDMKNYLSGKSVLNESYIYSRIGEQAIHSRESAAESKKESKHSVAGVPAKTSFSTEIFNFSRLKFRFKRKLLYIILSFLPGYRQFLETGKFRAEGEIHHWMYDRYSLKAVLSDIGFTNFRKTSAYESMIPNWNKYELEAKNERVFKPDSLFAEATKPKH